MRLLLLLALLIHIGTCCMAGYEAERDRIREFLGLEWVQGGMDRAGVEGSQTIRNDYDLSCDFSNPEKCRWKNSPALFGLDSRDFHLFEKQDYTEWPPLRLQPGPTKIPYGQRMLLTGDKLREEQTALLYSALVPCQNGTGNLTFTYWSFNHARLEVVLLQDNSTTKVPFYLPEKPYINCGTVPVNTNCFAEIPKREAPFRIGLRAYDIESPEGSLIIIDDIIYQAPLCRVEIDLGGTFVSAPLISSSTGEHIHKASDLLCTQFDRTCRWRSNGKTHSMWWRSDSQLSDQFLLSVTGSTIGPRQGFAVLYIKQKSSVPDTEKPLGMLRSDPIECQALTGSFLSFRFWATKDVVLEACALSLDNDQPLECHVAPEGVSPSPVTFSFNQVSKNFYIAIMVKSLNNHRDNVVIVDDISYKATFCNEALSPLDFGSNFVTTKMLSVLLGKHITSPKELWCDFSRRASDCAWGFVETEVEGEQSVRGVEWQIGNGPLDNEKFYSLTGQTLMPNGEFAVASFDRPSSSLLLSEVIVCVVKSATLSFHLWTSGTAVLRVCLVEENSPSLLDCQAASQGEVTVELPHVERPFRVALRADSDGLGVAIVDHIKLEGDVCGSSRQYSAKTYHLKPNEVMPDANVCRLLSCSFSRGHPCLYDSSQLIRSAQFTVTSGVLIAELNQTKPLAILESTPFLLNTVARLHFIYTIFGDVSLFVCNDSAGKELDNCFRVEGSGGEDFVELLPSDTKVYLLARALDKNGPGGSIQVKKLFMTDAYDEPVC